MTHCNRVGAQIPGMPQGSSGRVSVTCVTDCMLGVEVEKGGSSGGLRALDFRGGRGLVLGAGFGPEASQVPIPLFCLHHVRRGKFCEWKSDEPLWIPTTPHMQCRAKIPRTQSASCPEGSSLRQEGCACVFLAQPHPITGVETRLRCHARGAQDLGIVVRGAQSGRGASCTVPGKAGRDRCA